MAFAHTWLTGMPFHRWRLSIDGNCTCIGDSIGLHTKKQFDFGHNHRISGLGYLSSHVAPQSFLALFRPHLSHFPPQNIFQISLWVTPHLSYPSCYTEAKNYDE